jgi:hypothetical protein
VNLCGRALLLEGGHLMMDDDRKSLLKPILNNSTPRAAMSVPLRVEQFAAGFHRSRRERESTRLRVTTSILACSSQLPQVSEPAEPT